MSWDPRNRVTRPVYDGDDEYLIRYKAEGRFWGGGRLLKSRAWDDLSNNFHLPIWMQQDLLDHITLKFILHRSCCNSIKKEWPCMDVEALNFGELKEYGIELFDYDKKQGFIYKDVFPKIKKCEYGDKIKSRAV